MNAELEDELFDGLDPLDALIDNDVSNPSYDDDDDVKIPKEIDNKDNVVKTEITGRTKDENELLTDDEIEEDEEININNPMSFYKIKPSFKREIKREKRNLRCSIDNCNRKFLHRSTLEHHQNLHKTIELKCKFCRKVLPDLNILRKHQSKHLNEDGTVKLFRCYVYNCNKEFMCSNSLNEHESTHDLKKKLYLCDYRDEQLVCKKAFKRKESYLKHIKVHDTDVVPMCSTCGITFSCHYELNAHRFIHDKILRHSCDSCGAEFSNRFNLRRHEQIHCSKNFYCKVCFVNFNYVASLTKHMIKAHPIATRTLVKKGTLKRKNSKKIVYGTLIVS